MTRNRALRRALWGWTILASAAATIGGLIGWLEIDNDHT